MNKKKSQCPTERTCLTKEEAKTLAKQNGWRAYKCKLCGNWHVGPKKT